MRGAPRTEDGVGLLWLLLELDNVCPIITNSPSCKLPSAISVDTPSVRPTLILRVPNTIDYIRDYKLRTTNLELGFPIQG